MSRSFKKESRSSLLSALVDSVVEVVSTTGVDTSTGLDAFGAALGFETTASIEPPGFKY
jgi:hypothetical protein